MKLAYPIILTPFGHGTGYTVEVPDLPGCITEGDNLADALFMAEDAASLWVLGELEHGTAAPSASSPHDIRPERDDQLVSVVALDIDAYAEKYGTRAVRKNVTIPAWLNTWAEHHNVNYSHVLTGALEHSYQHDSTVD